MAEKHARAGWVQVALGHVLVQTAEWVEGEHVAVDAVVSAFLRFLRVVFAAVASSLFGTRVMIHI